MNVRFRIQRFDPDQDLTPHYAVYHVEVGPTTSVLDALDQIKGAQDGTLAYRHACRAGMCGSCGMLINGRNRLACTTRVLALEAEEVSVGALPGFAVLRDLIVDWDPFFAREAVMQPYLIADGPPPEQERRQTPAQLARFANATRCIQCGCCTSACPIVWHNGEYFGPAALTRLARYVFDSRDSATAERLALAASEEGAWRCHTIFNCSEDCPKGVQTAEAIQALKRGVALRLLGFNDPRAR